MSDVPRIKKVHWIKILEKLYETGFPGLNVKKITDTTYALEAKEARKLGLKNSEKSKGPITYLITHKLAVPFGNDKLQITPEGSKFVLYQRDLKVNKENLKQIKEANKRDYKIIGLQKTTIIIALLSLIAGILIQTGVFNVSKMVPVRQLSSDYVCPTDIYNQQFTVKFQNNGNRGSGLCITLSSDNFTFEKGRECTYIPVGATSQFSFKLSKDAYPISGWGTPDSFENFTVVYTGRYNPFLIFSDEFQILCSYEYAGHSHSWDLFNETIKW